MVDANPSHILSLFADRIEERSKREHAYLLAASGDRLDYPKAVAIATENLRRILHMPKLPNTGVGVDVFVGIVSVGKYFRSMVPSDAEIEEVLVLAKTDYYAFQAVQLLSHLRRGLPGPLRKWETERLIGTVIVPPKPKGQSAFANTPRDAAIVSEITKLEKVGFSNTRNRAESSSKQSGCDIVADALSRIGLGISYDAVETVWKNRNDLPSVKGIEMMLIDAVALAFGAAERDGVRREQ